MREMEKMIIEATCHECGATVMVEGELVKCSHCGKQAKLGRYLDLPGGGHICVSCLVRRVWARMVGFEIELTGEEESSEL